MKSSDKHCCPGYGSANIRWVGTRQQGLIGLGSRRENKEGRDRRALTIRSRILQSRWRGRALWPGLVLPTGFSQPLGSLARLTVAPYFLFIHFFLIFSFFIIFFFFSFIIVELRRIRRPPRDPFAPFFIFFPFGVEVDGGERQKLPTGWRSLARHRRLAIFDKSSEDAI